MKMETAKYKVQKYRKLIILPFILFALFSSLSIAAEQWPGVDESVVEKYASEHGREAHEPLINTDQGDLLLFVFLIAGTIGGFAAGYSWRIIMVEKPSTAQRKEEQ